MDNTINYGIDLGTTNSLIARFVKGSVEVLPNPTGFKATLPSVVWIRKDVPPSVGDKARERLEKAASDVFFRFKRRMGTTESYKSKALGKTLTPVDLSAIIVKELKAFVINEAIEAAVITIPAAFDNTQSNATKEAGQKAGLKQVLLLQEPIAASIAFANKRKDIGLQDGYWLVYDLGGGTFDLALVGIKDGEMKVVDHEGDNYLGGTDLDDLIVSQFVVPHLEENYQLEDLLSFKSASHPRNSLYYKLLHLAEEAKVELSVRSSSTMVMGFSDDLGEEYEIDLAITRSEFEKLIKPHIDRTVHMINEVISRSSLAPSDIRFVLMIGGSTYIPYVRQRVGELTGIPINCDINPTDAVAVGAAYYAGTQERKSAVEPTTTRPVGLRVKMVYDRFSRESEVMFAARIEGKITGLTYRITRDDGGYDSGNKALANRINEDLPLVPESYNVFHFRVYDKFSNPVPTDAELISIAQGIVSAQGQPLPEDICLEFDDPLAEGTALRLLFLKNSTLPQRTKVRVTVTKDIIKGSREDVIHINVYEGPHDSVPSANKNIGSLLISGDRLKKDVHKGSEIELTIEETESRDLKVEAFVERTEQTFTDVYKPEYRYVDINDIRSALSDLGDEMETSISEAVVNENYELAQTLKLMQQELGALVEESELISDDDVTDSKFQLDDKKRDLVQRIEKLTAPKRISALIKEYAEAKEKTQTVVTEHGNAYERKALKEALERDTIIAHSTNPLRIREAIQELESLEYSILRRVPDFLKGWYDWLNRQRAKYNNPDEASVLLDAGKKAIANEDYDKLAMINGRLHNLLPDSDKDEGKKRGWVGFTIP